MWWAILPAVLALGGCVSSSALVTPNGQQGFNINCSSKGMIGNAMVNRGSCLEEAGKRCPHGYTILDANEQGAYNTVVNEYGASQVPTYSRSMIVECKPPPPKTQ